MTFQFMFVLVESKIEIKKIKNFVIKCIFFLFYFICQKNKKMATRLKPPEFVYSKNLKFIIIK